MKLLGLLFGLDPELTFERRRARGVLLHGLRPPANAEELLVATT